MLDAATSGEWDLLTSLQQQREQLLPSSVSPAPSPIESNLTLATLRKVLSLNEKIVSIASDERRHRRTQLAGLQRSRRAAQSYKREARSYRRFDP
jgi:hypothetical protein